MNISEKLATAKLQNLRKHFGAFSAAEMRRKIAIKELKIAIRDALFLDENRRQKWLSAADILSEKEAKTLIGAILRENFRWKKGERKIEFSKNL